MPARRTMRQVRQMLRLHHDGVSARVIERTLGVACSTIQDNLERARKAGIGWPLPIEWSDEVLEQRLFARSGVKPGHRLFRRNWLGHSLGRGYGGEAVKEIAARRVREYSQWRDKAEREYAASRPRPRDPVARRYFSF